jgi:serine protease AprX
MGMRRLGLGGALSVALLAGAATAPAATAVDTTAGWGSDTTSADSGAVSTDPGLQDALATATDPVQVVVTFDGEGVPTAADVALLSDLGITTGRTFHSLPIAGVLATADQVAALEARPEVRSLYLNREVDYELDDYTALTGVDDVRTDAKLTKGNGGLPVTGDGVGVVVNDSGVDGTHSDLEFDDHLVQNVAAQTNLNALEPTLLPVTWVEDVPNTDSTGGHGTHVAGIVGATGERSSGKYEGVAPGADLVGYGSGAGLLLLDVLGGFDYALTHQVEYDIRVITNSWGTTSDRCTDVDPDDPVNVATKDAYDRNIVVVFSAGNSGPDECTITGNYKKGSSAGSVGGHAAWRPGSGGQ